MPSRAMRRLSAGLRTRPWRHQVEAYRFALERLTSGRLSAPACVPRAGKCNAQAGLSASNAQAGGAAMLAMMMGTGKSLVALMLLARLAARRTLIACPLRVVPVWPAHIERHLQLPVVVIALDDGAGSIVKRQKLAEEKLRLAEASGQPFIAVINYDAVWREPFGTWAEGQAWDLVIADESHKLKKPGRRPVGV